MCSIGQKAPSSIKLLELGDLINAYKFNKIEDGLIFKPNKYLRDDKHQLIII